MTFDVAADAYDRFMGRYSTLLAPVFADFAGVRGGQRAVDVGCGPGALTAVLAERLGGEAVAAAEPSESFAAAARERHAEADVRQAAAEALPFADDFFDVAVSQLVVNFMADPVAGLREMARVTRAEGTVAACVWDHAGGRTPLAPFWRAAGGHGESELPGAGQGRLLALFAQAGLAAAQEAPLDVGVEHATFDDWWQPFELGVGPAGAHLAALDDHGRADLRDRCRRELGDGPLTITGRAWAARASV